MLSRRQLLSASALLPTSLGATACRDRAGAARPGAREGSRSGRQHGAPRSGSGAACRVAADRGRRRRPLAALPRRPRRAVARSVFDARRFRSETPEDYIKGFPSHPHRASRPCTYTIDGAMEHRDSLGQPWPVGPRQRPVDDRGARHHPLGDAQAGPRPHVGLPALGEPAGAGEDAKAALPRFGAGAHHHDDRRRRAARGSWP